MTREEAMQHARYVRELSKDCSMIALDADVIDALLSNPWHKVSEELPTHFGDYLVILDSEQFGRRCEIKCWHGHPKDFFGDNPSREWVLDEGERVSYWMPIPEIKED